MNQNREREIPHFQGSTNVEEGYYTKTTLRNQFGLKPFDEADYDATARLYMYDSWRSFVLYHIDNCIEIKKRKVKEHPITDQTIAEALYLINKSAKVSRDTKQENYQAGKHRVVQTAKTRETKLYDLKEQVIGYHTSNGRTLLLFELSGFTFHTPVKQGAEMYKYLGELHQLISAKKTKAVSLNFFEAENLLKRYVSSGLVE